MRRAWLWTFSNVVPLVILSLAISQDWKWAENMALFWYWAWGVMEILAAGSEESRQMATDRGRPVPAELSMAMDFTVMGVMAAGGWWASAVLWIIQMGAEVQLFKEWDKKNRKERDTGWYPRQDR